MEIRALIERSVASGHWQLRGACRDLDSEWFFHPEGERGSARIRREAKAKAICRCCPVLAQCRAYALTAREPYGVWGGLSHAERELIITGSARLLAEALR